MKILRHFLMLGSSLLLISCIENVDPRWEDHCVLINNLDTPISIVTYDCTYENVISNACDNSETFTIEPRDTVIIGGSVGSYWLSTYAVIEFYMSDSLFRTNHHYKYWAPLFETDSSECNSYYTYVIDDKFLKMAMDSVYYHQ